MVRSDVGPIAGPDRSAALNAEQSGYREHVYSGKGSVVRLVYLVVAMIVWLITIGGRVRRNGVVVLCYHGVRDEQRERFARQLRSCRGRFVPASDIGKHTRGRGRPRVALTFDDAFANLLDNMIPALQEASGHATIFAVSGNLGEAPRWSMPDGHPDRTEQTMTEQEIAGIAGRDDIEIGSHTRTHPRLCDVSVERLREELSDSKADLERICGGSISDLALPHGAGGAEVEREAQRAGYERIYTLEHRIERSGESDPPTVGRFSMSPDIWPIEHRLTIDGAYAWLGAFRSLVRRIRGGRATQSARVMERAA